MNATPSSLDPWALDSLEVSKANFLPHEPGVFMAYRKRRILYIGIDGKSIRNGWFRKQPSTFLEETDTIRIAYQVLPHSSTASLEALYQDLVDSYDPHYSGKTQTSLREYQGVIKKLMTENKALKTLIKKERAVHAMGLCQSKVYLVAKLLSDLEAGLSGSRSLEAWMQEDKTSQSVRAVLAVLEEIEVVIAPYDTTSPGNQ
ncbi:hypothetical protein [Leptolyngbya sp. KIOST-1]|uniref:hypothetical protein n=1 Tax=Leptolyngbya sp. KIOST-1 TaxID=1229172 RepID=UPI0005683D06|nr:hypothetical protein [Leptolyngbya sp. KIOST-1]